MAYLNRDKEKNLTIELSNYLNAKDINEKINIKQKILQIFAGNSSEANDFLKPAVLKQKDIKAADTQQQTQTPPTQQKQAEK